jgi:YidC/Oxa1 family membrane protein insertase
MMKLQQEEGFNPLAGCLPMFLQLPVFWGLYHVLRHLSNSVNAVHALQANGVAALTSEQARQLTLYGFSRDETASAAVAKLFGSAPLAARLTDSSDQIHALLGDVGPTRIVVAILVLISASATFTTQLLVRRSQVTPPEGTAATIQRLMLFGIPMGTLGSGLFFPLGVLLYWFTSNTWTMAQQLYINKFHPQEEPEKSTVGELGKTLAPKVGQRPVRPGRNAGQGNKQSSVKEAPPAEAATRTEEADSSSLGQPRTTPRPGQRPQRAGSRPPARRPTQAKKRR